VLRLAGPQAQHADPCAARVRLKRGEKQISPRLPADAREPRTSRQALRQVDPAG
jgi:hypothetical protein